MKQKNRINAIKSNLSWAHRVLIGKFALILLLGLLIGSAAFVFVSASATRNIGGSEKPISVLPQPGIAGIPTAAQDGDYVRRVRLWPQLHGFLGRLGDRLEKPGRERLALHGSITRSTDSEIETHPIHLITEYPNRLRLEEQRSDHIQITIFNQGETFTTNSAIRPVDLDVIETLVFDTADHFFNEQMQGSGIRFLGSRFRLDNGEKADYSGPFLDVYQVSEQIRIGSRDREQLKFYCFNSDTQLLDRAQYQVERDGATIGVSVLFENWQKVQGQMLPGRIERVENGRMVVSLDVVSASFVPRLSDGAFTKP